MKGALAAVGDARRLPIADRSVDLVIGSPPYAEKGERYDGMRNKWKLCDWVVFMLFATKEALRISRGPVIWIVNNPVRKGRYIPASEMLLSELYQEGVVLDRPLIWHKNAAPNRRDYFRNDWESVLVFRPEDDARYFDWEAIAKPPKFKAGGAFHQRDSKGKRKPGGEYPTGKLARPGDVIRATVGGGHLGSRFAHENEAPFPESLIEPLIVAFSPVGGLVIDPFGGSGTVGAVSLKTGRSSISVDVRRSQAALALKRWNYDEQERRNAG